MWVPDFLFGSARGVRGRVRKVIMRLQRGESLETICETADRVNLLEHMESLIWVERAFVLRESAARDYRAVQLSEQLFDSRLIPFERSNEIREQSAEYLSKTPWGTVVLNSGTPPLWAHALPLVPLLHSRQGHVAILQGTLRHWDEFVALGKRFYSGGYSGHRFPQALPAYGYVLAQYGLDVRGKRDTPSWRPIHELCDEAFVERIATDDRYWQGLVKGWQSKAGTPELASENLAEIVSLCEKGSWNAKQWAFVASQLGAEAVERALATLEASGAYDKLLGVFVHALGDMQRATDVYTTHVVTMPSLAWARVRVAEFLAATAPARAAQLFIDEAEYLAKFGKKSDYKRGVATLVSAKATLVRADLYSLWKGMLARFVSAHGRRKQLMAELATAFPGEI